MADRDLSSGQVERLRAAVKQLWVTGKYSTKTAMAKEGRVYQAQISNLLNDAPVGISFPTADKICRNLLGKKADAVIGAADDPAPEKTELEFALDMAKVGHIPDEAIAATLERTKPDAPYDRFDWLFLFRGAANGIVQREAAKRPKPMQRPKKKTVEPLEAIPRSKRKVAGDE